MFRNYLPLKSGIDMWHNNALGSAELASMLNYQNFHSLSVSICIQVVSISPQTNISKAAATDLYG
jgi:hypothetical protein